MEEAGRVSLLEPVDGGVHEVASSSSALTAARKGVITQMPPAGAVDQSQLSRPPTFPPLVLLHEYALAKEAAVSVRTREGERNENVRFAEKRLRF